MQKSIGWVFCVGRASMVFLSMDTLGCIEVCPWEGDRKYMYIIHVFYCGIHNKASILYSFQLIVSKFFSSTNSSCMSLIVAVCHSLWIMNEYTIMSLWMNIPVRVQKTTYTGLIHEFTLLRIVCCVCVYHQQKTELKRIPMTSYSWPCPAHTQCCFVSPGVLV